MKITRKIAVIGGTGKSGTYLTRELVRQGFQLKLLLRNPEHFQRPHATIEIIKGDARDYKAVRLLAEGCTAVISTLGQPKGEPSIFSEATGNVIRAMQEYGSKRYIVTTGLSVDTPMDKKRLKTAQATDWMTQHFPETTFDKQAEYRILAESDLDWTLVRLPLIMQIDQRAHTSVSLEDCPGDTISATDLASFLIEQLDDDSYLQRAPFIANI